MDFDFTKWVNYFQLNKRSWQTFNRDEKYQLTSEEYQTIYRSIQQFQIGESSEGKYLIKSANRYLSSCNDKSYIEALVLFIQEEQRHASELAFFMEKQEIPKIKKHWIDQVFRKLRRFSNLEQSITVLLTAEIIAMVYYDALRRVTKSPLLIAICEQILRDETKHVEFQSMALNHIAKNRNRLFKVIYTALRHFFLMGTLTVVWFYHFKVLKAGGYSLVKYFKRAINEFHRAEILINQ